MRAARAFIPVALLAAALAAGCNKSNDPGTGGGSTVAATSAAPTPNGVADLAPAEILDKAKTALAGASSFRAKGDINAEGQKIAIDLKSKGNDLTGTLGVNGAEMQILRVGSDIYLKGSAAFWKTVDPQRGETIAALLGDKWAKAPSSTAGIGDLASLADPSKLLKADGTVTKADTKTINGVEAIGLKDSSGEGTLYIATVGEPYPLQIMGPANEGEITFSEFGAEVDIKAPASTEVVDLSKLTGGA
jgi:hypothetical protein